MVIEHLCKDAEHRSLILVDRAFNVDIEKDGLGLATGSLVNQHERGRIIRELLAEHFDRRNTANRLVLKDIGEHLQEVRFTTSKEAGDPYADIVSGLIKGVAIVVKEADEMLLQFFCDDVLSNFLLDNVRCILIDFDDTIDLSVDVLSEHVTNHHVCILLRKY